MEKQFVDLLTEELKLQEMVTEEQARHLSITVLQAKLAASQYQKEAEKSNAAMKICEKRALGEKSSEYGLGRRKGPACAASANQSLGNQSCRFCRVCNAYTPSR